MQLEKTIEMCTNSVVPDFINEIGFTAVGSVTILGLEIEGDSGVFRRSFEKICAKLRNKYLYMVQVYLQSAG